MKIKFKAFSYVELLFGMVIIAFIFIASVPFLTRKANTGNATTGEFQCYTAFDSTRNEYRLYERLKRNGGDFSEPVDVTENGCKFFRPKNVNTYTLQVIGGGGGGSVTFLTPYYSHYSGAYYTALVYQYSNVQIGENGEDGQQIEVQTSLGGVWDENGVLVIRKCQNAGEDVPQSDPYREEFRYCVGDGGMVKNSIVGIGKVGGSSVKEMEYWNLLGVYHDVLFNSRTNVNAVQYAGRGDGTISVADDLVKVRAVLGEAHSVYINLNRYLTSGLTDIQALREAVGQLKTVITRWSFAPQTQPFSGGAGGYSRFVLKDENMTCPQGNCLARGGSGGTSNENVICSNAMSEDGQYCSVNVDMCYCADTPNSKDISACLTGGLICNARPTNVFGGGGLAGGALYLYRDRSNLWTYGGFGGVGGGGAIIIKW